MSKGIAIRAAVLAGFGAVLTPVFAAAADLVPGCVNAFGTEVFSKRDDRAGDPAVRSETRRLMPCNLGDGGCQDLDWADPAGSDEWPRSSP